MWGPHAKHTKLKTEQEKSINNVGGGNKNWPYQSRPSATSQGGGHTVTLFQNYKRQL